MNKNVQIVHIEGVKKGDIETFNQKSISIGRNPKCDVVYPADLLIISRLHAKIEFQDGQFVLNNIGSNGCYVNGQKINTTTLKSGDVITFADGGPKLSFLISKNTSSHQQRVTSGREIPTHKPAKTISKPRAEINNHLWYEFTIQYGLMIKSFNKQLISLGKSQRNDFQIENPNLSDKHIELYFSGKDCFIRRISKQSNILVDDIPLETEARLSPGSRIALSDHGPLFTYLGEGRLSQVIERSTDLMEESINYKQPNYVGKHDRPTLLDAVKSVIFKRY